MPQTTGAITFKDAKVESSPDGAVWTDISGFHNLIDPSGGDRDVGSKFTLAADTAIITAGKRKPLNIKVNIVYTEGASDPTEIVRQAYENATKFYVRWSPKGG